VFKGTLSRDFLHPVFFMGQFPPALEYPIRTFSIFFENSRRYLLVKVHTRYQQHQCQCHRGQNSHRYKGHRLQIATGINDTGSKLSPRFASVVDTSGKFATSVNDNGGKFATGVNDTGGNCHWYQQHRWQIWKMRKKY
jgi:hypothetical protein